MAVNIIGLDIGTNSMKLVCLKQTKKLTTLKNFAIIPLPAESIVDGALMNTSAISDSLGKILRELKIKSKKVALSISGHSVFVRFIRTTTVNDDELEEHIKWDAESYIPVNINDVYIDFQKLTDTPDQSGEIEVLLVAAKRNMVDEYDQLVKSVGLKPSVVDIDAFALQNVYEFNYPNRFRDENIVIINIGSAITNINIIEKGISKFVRDISIGGMEVTEAVSQYYGLSVEEAESIKLGALQGDTNLVNSKELHSIYERVTNRIAGEILQTIDYYRTQVAGDDIDRLYLSGGGSKVELIARRLGESSGIQIEYLDPFNNINIDPRLFDIDFIRETSVLASVAVGLALRKVES